MSGADDARSLLQKALDSTDGEYFSKTYMTVSEKESTRVSLITAIKLALTNEYYKQAASLIDFGSVKVGKYYTLRIRKLVAPEYFTVQVEKRDGTKSEDRSLILTHGMRAQLHWLASTLMADNRQAKENTGKPQYTDEELADILEAQRKAFEDLEYYRPKRVFDPSIMDLSGE